MHVLNKQLSIRSTTLRQKEFQAKRATLRFTTAILYYIFSHVVTAWVEKNVQNEREEEKAIFCDSQDEQGQVLRDKQVAGEAGPQSWHGLAAAPACSSQ